MSLDVALAFATADALPSEAEMVCSVEELTTSVIRRVMQMRFRVGLLLLVAVAVTGCTDEELPSGPKVVPARLTIVPPSLGSTEFPLGSAQDPVNSMALPTYNDLVIVRFGVTGEF